MSILDKSASALGDEYAYYYEQCEKANRIPLSFDNWLKTQQSKESNHTTKRS